MSNYKLKIKDSNGDERELYVDSGSNGIVPYHAISGSVTTTISNFPATQNVTLSNAGSLTASVSVSNWPGTQNVTASTIVQKATTSTVTMYSWDSSITASVVQVSASKSLIVNNQTNASLFLAISQSVNSTNYSYIIEPYGYYESTAQDSQLTHSLLLSSPASSGSVAVTKTS